MFRLISKRHKELSYIEKKEIVILKNTHWKYSVSEHLKYFKKNYKNIDLHNLLFYKKKLIGYTGLRYQSFIYKNKKSKYLHFDCLIIEKKYRDKNLSNLLMNFNMMIINKSSLPSILFCEKNLVNYYKKFKWILSQKLKIILSIEKKEKKKFMFYNMEI